MLVRPGDAGLRLLAYLPLAVLANHLGHRPALLCAGLLCAAALLLWWRNLAQARALRDTPVARLASAAQGYVEVRGELRGFDDGVLTLPGSDLPCVWFNCQVQELQDREWRTVEHLRSQQSLRLHDGSGECLVFWEQAQMLGMHRGLAYQGAQRFVQSWLSAGDAVTVVGELRTRSGDADGRDLDAEVAGLLEQWKHDRPRLLHRFDRNGDGEIDLEEWEEVRRTARATVMREHAGRPARDDTHVIGPAANGRPFLINALAARGTRWRSTALVLLDSGSFLYGLWLLGQLLRQAGP